MACQKVRYRDLISAKTGLKEVQNMPGYKTEVKKYYYCSLCKGYHLTKDRKMAY